MMQMKMLAAAALAGALLSSTAVPSQAAHGRHAAAAIGFGVGALAGAAVASAATQPYYGSAYYVDGPYAYEPGYAYEPDYVYAPAPVYVEPAPAYVYTQPAPVYSAPPAYVARPAPRRTSGTLNGFTTTSGSSTCCSMAHPRQRTG